MNITADTAIIEMLSIKLDASINNIVDKAIERLPTIKPFNKNDHVTGMDAMADALGVDYNTIYMWKKQGYLDGCYSKIGGVYIFNIPDVLEAHKSIPTRKPKSNARRR